MRGELSFVEGHWAALAWAFGGASVMAKQALMSIFIPGRGQGIPPGDGAFRQKSVRGQGGAGGGRGMRPGSAAVFCRSALSAGFPSRTQALVFHVSDSS